MKLITYKKYTEVERVEVLTKIFQKNGIEFEVTEDRDSLDSLYGHDHKQKNYYVKINQTDFLKADAILETLSEEELQNVDDSHYLFDFSDQELLEILNKPDEWNEFDYQLAKRILKDRGNEVSSETLQMLKKQRIDDLSKPDESHRVWMYIGYIFALMGGLLGMFVGWHLITFKKTLPDGQRIYGYNESDRRHGNRIFVIGMIMFMIFILAAIFDSH